MNLVAFSIKTKGARNFIRRLWTVFTRFGFSESRTRHALYAVVNSLRQYSASPTFFIPAVVLVNSSEKLPKSATPKVSRGGEFYVGTQQCQSKNPQNMCSLKRCPSFVIYKPSYLLVISSCPSPCVFREVEGVPFTGFAARSWNTPALRFSRRR